MKWGFTGNEFEAVKDGLGERRVELRDGRTVDVLVIAPALAQHPAFEAEVRAKAARFGDRCIERLATVLRIDREGARLSVTSDHIDGLRLSSLLEAAPLPSTAAIALAGQVIRAVATLHQKPGLTHGAITPDHIVIASDGTATLTDGVFAGALESLQRNREQLWREFRVAMPSAASLARFDVRSDVTQLGATVLSLVLGRHLRDDEYPRPIADVINAATPSATIADAGSPASPLRMWFHQALQLHPGENFATGIDAERAFASMLGTPSARRAATAALQAALRNLMGPASDTIAVIGSPLSLSGTQAHS